MPFTSAIPILLFATLLGACAADAPTRNGIGTAGGGSRNLGCPLSSNCVSTIGSGALVPLVYAGTPAQATALLAATLKTFPEATIEQTEPLAMVAIFTTRVGFRDQVDFRIDPALQRVDFRSRSLFGLFDWGKNRSRMEEFSARFRRQAGL